MFPFEGFFKICHGLYFGTRDKAEHILTDISIKDKISYIKNSGLEFQKICLINLYFLKYLIKIRMV